MKIKKFTKGKENQYLVEIEDYDKIKLYDDTILKYNLLIKKEIKEEELKEILKYNTKKEAYYKALKYITKKLRTKKEMFTYLAKVYTKKTTEETIKQLEQENYFNEELYLKSYINDAVRFSNKGPHKIIAELIKLGFEPNEIEKYFHAVKENIWLEKIEKNIKYKIRTNHQYGFYKLKEKIKIDLITMGYPKHLIEQVLNGVELPINQTSLMQKEYKRIINKLNKKYSGENLQYQLKMKLLLKGFTQEEVETFLQNTK